jgi:hypothetical protein
MYEEMLEGRFRLPGPETILKETRLLLADLNVNSEFMSDHVSNLLPLHGRLPAAKEEMVRTIDEALQDMKEDDQLREAMEARRHLTNL